MFLGSRRAGALRSDAAPAVTDALHGACVHYLPNAAIWTTMVLVMLLATRERAVAMDAPGGSERPFVLHQ